MKHLSAEPRCTNTILKPEIDPLHWPNSQKGLDRLPRERCARPLLPIYTDDDLTVGHFCAHCDGPIHQSRRGPEVTAEYNRKRIESIDP